MQAGPWIRQMAKEPCPPHARKQGGPSCGSSPNPGELRGLQ
jgi:hypothetical protein